MKIDRSMELFSGDDAPDTVFGITVVKDESQYTEADMAFFRAHPEAAGYYDMEDGEDEEEGQADELGGSAWDPVDVKGTGHVVFPAAYNSALSDTQEAQYQAWRSTLPRPLQYEGDYDLRGYWLDPETVKDNVKDGQHFIDKYKKPNHPTFSVESRYATGDDARLAGTWDGDRYVPSQFVARMAPEAVYRRVEDAIALAVPFVKRHEGFRAKAYRDAVGKWTVGYGQTEIRDPATGRMRPVKAGDTVGEADAAAFVASRVRADAAEMYRSMPWTRRAGAGAIAQLLDISYNLGLGALSSKSPALNRDGSKAVSEYDVNQVVWRETPTYRAAGGKVLNGLVNRRADGLKEFRDDLNNALPGTNVNRNAVPTTVTANARRRQ